MTAFEGFTYVAPGFLSDMLQRLELRQGPGKAVGKEAEEEAGAQAGA
jgi:hypothetical protein